ncbi:MAG: D-alanyl-D-alanine carboxypeptidase, partial [Balneolaceae bacterium]
MKLIILSSALTVLFLSACKPAERITDATEPPGKLEQLSSAIDQIFTRSDIFSQSFTGFSLYDPENDLELYSFNGGRNFIPASNTKLFTFYAGLLTLPERVPALAYIEREDSLIFWGTGDPSFLHHDFGSDSVYQFLKSHESSLYFSDSNFKDNHLGSGWAWDDYNYYYSAEKSPLPVYGNVARFGIDEIRTTRLSRNNGEVIVSPSYFKNHIK